MNKIEEVVIIGDGVAAKLTAFYLYKLKSIKAKIIASENFAPKCSTRSTSINCLRGTQKGISPLGDLIVNSYEDFVNFFIEYQPSGIEKSCEIQLWDKDFSKWQKRYPNNQELKKISFLKNEFNTNYKAIDNEAYIISPEHFFEWIDAQYPREFLDDYVVSIEKTDLFKIQTQNEITIYSKNIVICTSYESNLFLNNVKEENVKKSLNLSKPVSGTYLRFNISDFEEKEFNTKNSFSLVFNEVHFIYRPFAKDVLIGSTSTNNSKVFLPDLNGAQLLYNEISKRLEGAISIPSFENAKQIVGIRHKGQKRTPYWGEIDKNAYGIWGLYKNAYTFAFSAALEISKAIN